MQGEVYTRHCLSTFRGNIPGVNESSFYGIQTDNVDKTIDKRNIMIVSSIFFPHIFGGAEIAAYNRAVLLSKRGYNVSVITLKEKDAPPSLGDMSPEGFRIYRIKTPRHYTLFERTQNLPAWRKAVWHLHDYFDRRNPGMIGSILDKVNPDYIFIDNLIGLGFNSLAEIGRRDIPVAYMLHDLNLACFNTGMFKEEKICKRQCLQCKMVGVLRQAPLKKVPRLGFISPSRSNLEKTRKMVPATDRALSAVIQNVPEAAPPLAERKNSDHVRLLFAGRIDPVKGIEFLLRTLDGLSRDHHFHLTVLGTGPSEQRLRTEYGGRKWVTFRGFVPRHEIASVLMESDLYCMTSLVAESYGLVTAQALQLGTPVIGSDAGGTAELVRNGVTGMLVRPGDEQAWRDAFLKIFSEPSLLRQWSENAARYAHEFNEDTIMQAYEEFLEKLSASPPVISEESNSITGETP